MQQTFHLDLCLYDSRIIFLFAQKYQPQLTQQMKLYYEDELARALAEDVQLLVHTLHQKHTTQEHNAKIRYR